MFYVFTVCYNNDYVSSIYLLCVIINIPVFYVFTVCYNKDSVCSMYLLCVKIKISCVLCIYCVL